MKKTLFTFAILLLGQCVWAQSVVRTMMHDGMQRSYRIYVPTVYDGSLAVPLVFNLHGYTSNAFEQEVYGDFRTIADTANFILVHPDGTEDVSGTTFWNAFGSPTETVDDIGFLSALIDTVAASYNIDMNRVYSTGMSNGGFMSYTLACQLSHRITAIASVTGTMVTPNLNACNCQHPMPVMQVHGTADPTVPYLGNPQGFVAVEDLVAYWAAFNNCNPTPSQSAVPDIDITDGCTTDHFVTSGGDAGTSVELFRVNGGAHTWPGANPFFSTLGVTSQDFSASAEIWRFFSQYRLNELVGVDNVTSTQGLFSVFPNPNNGEVHVSVNKSIDASVEVRNTLGQVVYANQQITSPLQIVLPESGVYFVIVRTGSKLFAEKIIRN